MRKLRNCIVFTACMTAISVANYGYVTTIGIRSGWSRIDLLINMCTSVLYSHIWLTYMCVCSHTASVTAYVCIQEAALSDDDDAEPADDATTVAPSSIDALDDYNALDDYSHSEGEDLQDDLEYDIDDDASVFSDEMRERWPNSGEFKPNDQSLSLTLQKMSQSLIQNKMSVITLTQNAVESKANNMAIIHLTTHFCAAHALCWQAIEAVAE